MRVSLWWLLLPAAVLVVGVRVLRRVLAVQRVRVDPLGDGHFGAPRGDHVHEGVDLLAAPGEMILSPVDGVFAGTGLVYGDDARFTLVRIDGEGQRWLLMYVVPSSYLSPGDRVRRGQLVGYAQDVVVRYGAPMLAHVHVEVYRLSDGHLLDPERLLVWDRA